MMTLQLPPSPNWSQLDSGHKSPVFSFGARGLSAASLSFPSAFPDSALIVAANPAIAPIATRMLNHVLDMWPFSSGQALFNLSKLAVWWLRLGIGIERIKPGHPQQNGPHERMPLTLKKETTKPAGLNFLQQQARFDDFIEIFNNERPHEALGMKCPVEVYQPSTRLYKGLPDIDYPFHDKTIIVTRCGRICLGRKKINFSTVFAGQAVGVKEVHDDIWLVSFMDYDLGYFDLDTRVLEPLENPFGPRSSPM